MLTAGDEYPIHQTPEPIAYSGSDRNFYDRYFFNGYSADGKTMFGGAMGVYPHLNIIDGAISILRDGKQESVYMSRPLNMERMDTFVGPMSVEVIKPLNSVRLKLEETDGIALDVTFTGRSFPIEEPRFTQRRGPRMVMDLTRMTQNGTWSGKLRINGEDIEVGANWFGTRDRSWGVRPIGAPDPQPILPAVQPQVYWIWTPTHFEDFAMYFHVNEDAAGDRWNTRMVVAPDGAGHEGHVHLVDPRIKVNFKSGTRRMETSVLTAKDDQGREHKVSFEPFNTFQMKGIGYWHPTFKHGACHGEQLVVQRESADISKLSWKNIEDLHIQALAKVRYEHPDGKVSEGVGAYEQLFLGPHNASGFVDMLDPAK